MSDTVLTGKEGYGSINIWESIGKGKNCYILKMVLNTGQYVFTSVPKFEKSFVKDTGSGKFDRFVITTKPIETLLKGTKTPTGFVFKK